MGAGLTAGLIAFFVVASFTGLCVMHNASSGAAFTAGAIAAVWAGLPFLSLGKLAATTSYIRYQLGTRCHGGMLLQRYERFLQEQITRWETDGTWARQTRPRSTFM